MTCLLAYQHVQWNHYRWSRMWCGGYQLSKKCTSLYSSLASTASPCHLSLLLAYTLTWLLGRHTTMFRLMLCHTHYISSRGQRLVLLSLQKMQLQSRLFFFHNPSWWNELPNYGTSAILLECCQFLNLFPDTGVFVPIVKNANRAWECILQGDTTGRMNYL